MINSPSVAIVAEAPTRRAIAPPERAAKASPAIATIGKESHRLSSCPARKPGSSGSAVRCNASGMVRMPDRYAPNAMNAPCPKDTIPVLPQKTASATTATTFTDICTAIRSPVRPKIVVSPRTTMTNRASATPVRIRFAAAKRAGWVASGAIIQSLAIRQPVRPSLLGGNTP